MARRAWLAALRFALLGSTLAGGCDDRREPVVSPSNPAVWELVMYPSGFNGLQPPELLGEPDGLPMYLLSITPNPNKPRAEQFEIGVSNHVAVVFRADENETSRAEAPTEIFVDLVSFDPKGREMDRVEDVPLLLNEDDGDPATLTYHNDLRKPIILIDTEVDKSAYPNVVLLYGSPEGTADIRPSDSPAPRSSEPMLAEESGPPMERPADPVAAAIRDLESYRKWDDLRIFQDAMQALREHLHERGPETYERLFAVLLDDEIPLPVRTQVAALCVELCNEETAGWLVGRILEFGRGTLSSDYERGSVLVILLSRLDNQTFIDALSKSAEAKGFLIWMLAEKPVRLSEDVGSALLDKADLSVETKREVAIEVVRRDVWRQVTPYLGPGAEDELMTIVRDSGRTPVSIHRAAAEALVHFGSQEFAAHLKEIRGEFAAFSDPTLPTLSAQAGAILDFWLRKIELQRTPETLLEFIASASTDYEEMQLRRWAFERAHERGVPDASLRKAVLAHASAARPKILAISGRLEKLTRALELRYLRDQARAIGVLREDELVWLDDLAPASPLMRH